MGQIYKITNLVNGKIYIGQTRYTADIRFRGHIAEATKPHKSNYPLYKAFNKYGVHNFKVEVLEECANDKLNSREKYYINLFNSFNAGYNQTLGGDGGKVLELDEEFIINIYNECKSLRTAAEILGISTSTIKNILDKHQIKLYNTPNSMPIGLVQIEKDTLKIINVFNSKNDAYRWVRDNIKPDLKDSTFYYYATRACKTRGVAFGYHWAFSDENPNIVLEELRNKKSSNTKPIVSENILREAFIRNSFNKEATGRELGVTGKTIAKWLKVYNIEQV